MGTRNDFYRIHSKLFFAVKSSEEGSEVGIRFSVVQTPCGNVIHTLINTHEYKQMTGMPFLPGFANVVDERKLSHFSIENEKDIFSGLFPKVPSVLNL